MSVVVMGLVYRARLGSQTRKSVALALADHAEDDGTSVYPSVARIAYKAECSERSVQYALRDLEEMGLIEIVREGGRDGKSTSEYRFNILRLHHLAGLVDVDDRGAIPAPLPNEGRKGCTGGVQEATDRGAPVAPKPSITIKQPSARAGVRMRDDRASPALKTEAAAGHHIKADERPAEYKAWLEWHRRHSVPSVANLIEQYRQLIAPSLMPET